jgi:hypothetical protein
MLDSATSSLTPRAIGVGRVFVGLLVIAVLVYTYVLGIPAGRVNLWDYFGYFTNLTSLLVSGLLLASGWLALRRRAQPSALSLARGVGTACMMLVAVIYNLIVPGTGTAPMWVSVLLHAVLPVAVVLDWLLVPDRAPLAWRKLWWVTIYPLVWIVVVLIRGVTDGWVPYGFLLPERGPAVLALHVVGLLAALLALGALTWLGSRLQLRSRTATIGR